MKYSIVVAVFISVIATGCSEDTSDSSSIREARQSAEEIRAEVVDTTGVDLVPLDFLDWNLQMSSIAGQVVVMDFWATWCTPCLDRFPAMLELSRLYDEKDVRFISINLDDYTNEDAFISAHNFLSYVGSDIENFHFLQEDFAVYEFFGMSRIPATLLYNRTGEEQQRFGDDGPEIRVEDIAAAINFVLASPIEEI